MLLFLAFTLLLIATLFVARREMFARTGEEWLVDSAGLVVQGVIVPLLQTYVFAVLLRILVPTWRGALDCGFALGFVLNFVVLDYLYYWNHRLLHRQLWRWHAVHHTAKTMDVVVTSRNTLWTPLLIVYVWVNAVMLLLLHDPSGYVAGITLTAALDLWRHSPLRFAPRIGRIASLLFITPQQHAWHHSTLRSDVNFGANLSLWDRLHGTFEASSAQPSSLGIALERPILADFLLGAPTRGDAFRPSGETLGDRA